MENSRKISFIVRIAAIAIIIIFFVPTFCVSCGDYEFEFSAFDLAIGKADDKLLEDLSGKDYDREDDDLEAAIILFVIIILAAIIVKYANGKSKLSLICSIGCLISMPLTKYIIQRYIDDEGYARYTIDLETTFAYSLHIILSIIIIVALLFEKYVLNDLSADAQLDESLLMLFNKVKKLVVFESNNSNSNINTNTYTNTSKYQTDYLKKNTNTYSIGSFCGNCGSKMQESNIYCPNCGTKREHGAPKDNQSWTCSCGAVNSSSSSYCNTCFKNRD